MKQLLNRLINQENITSEEAKNVLVNISKGDGTPYNHLRNEFPEAINSINNNLNAINRRIIELQKKGISRKRNIFTK